MNKIYKVVWSKVRNCYVVASELAKRHTKGSGARRLRRAAVTLGVAAALVGGISGSAWAEDVAIISNSEFNSVLDGDYDLIFSAGANINISYDSNDSSDLHSGNYILTFEATDTTYAAGNGLELVSGNKFQVKPNGTSITVNQDGISVNANGVIEESNAGIVTGGTVYNAVKDKADSSTVTAIDTRVTTAEGKITALETTIGDTETGLVKSVADNKSDITTLQTTVGDANSGLVKDVSTNAANIALKANSNGATLENVIINTGTIKNAVTIGDEEKTIEDVVNTIDNTKYISSPEANTSSVIGTLKVAGTSAESGGIINVDGPGGGINIAGTGSYLKVGNGNANTLEVDVGNNQVKAVHGNFVIDSNGAITTPFFKVENDGYNSNLILLNGGINGAATFNGAGDNKVTLKNGAITATGDIKGKTITATDAMIIGTGASEINIGTSITNLQTAVSYLGINSVWEEWTSETEEAIKAKYGVDNEAAYDALKAASYDKTVYGATGTGAIAIGKIAVASQTDAIAIGTNSKASSINAIAIGNKAEASNNSTTALGDQAKATYPYATALGAGAEATQYGTIAIGSGEDYEHNPVHATASGPSAIAIGDSAQAAAGYTIAMGSNAKTDNNGIGAIAIGFSADASGNNPAIAIGRSATAWQGTAVGHSAGAHGAGSTAIGESAQAGEEYATAIGLGAKATGISATALGGNASASLQGAVALGSNTTVNAGTTVESQVVGGVTLSSFAGSLTDTNKVVSVGSAAVVADETQGISAAPEVTRQIQHVAPGAVTATSTDAINGSQLYAVANQLQWKIGTGAATGTTGTSTGALNDAHLTVGKLSSTVDRSNVTLVAGKDISLTSTASDTNGYEITIASTVVPTEVAAGTNVASVTSADGTSGQKIYTVNADGTTVSKGSDYVTVTAGIKNTTTNLTDYQVDLSDSVKASLGSADSAMQSFKTRVTNGTTKTEAQEVKSGQQYADFVAGDNIVLTGDATNGITIATKGDVSFTSVQAATITATTSVTVGGTVIGDKTATIGDVAINGSAKTITAGGIAIDGANNTLKVGGDTGITLSNSTTGNSLKVGGVTISDNGTAKTITGLSNTTWDANSITSGQAATEDQLKSAITSMSGTLTNTGLKFTANSGGSVTNKLGSTVSVIGGGTKADDKYSDSNVKTVIAQDATGNSTITVKMDENPSFTSVTATGNISGKDITASGMLSSATLKVGGVDVTTPLTTVGKVESSNAGFVTGGTVYSEVRPAADGNYVKTANTTAANLTALDSAIGSVAADGNYIKASATSNVAQNLTALDTQVKTNADNIAALQSSTTAAVGTIDTDGNYIKKSDTNNVSQNLIALDTQMKTNADNIAANKAAIGTTADGSYVKAAETVGKNLNVLDTQVKTNTDDIATLKNSISVQEDASGTKTTTIDGNLVIKEDDGTTKDVTAALTTEGEVAKQGEAGSEGYLKGETVYDYLNKGENGKEVKLAKESKQIAVGQGSVASGVESIAIGNETGGQKNQATGLQSIAIGFGNQVTGAHSGAIGDPTYIAADNSYAIGNSNNITATGARSFAIGNNNTISGSDTFVLGSNVNTNASNAVVLGNNSDGEDGAVSVGSVGGERQIKHVAPGTDANDAATVGQVAALAQNTTTVINRVDSKLNKVGAGAAALAALHPLDTDDKFTMGMGYGNYRNSHAAAIGMFYRPTDKIMISMSGTMGNGENMFNAGISFALDKGKGFSTSKAAMARKIAAQEEKISEQDAKIQSLAAENAKLAERLAAIEAKLSK